VAGTQELTSSTGDETASKGNVASGFVPVVVDVASATSTAAGVYVV